MSFARATRARSAIASAMLLAMAAVTCGPDSGDRRPPGFGDAPERPGERPQASIPATQGDGASGRNAGAAAAPSDTGDAAAAEGGAGGAAPSEDAASLAARLVQLPVSGLRPGTTVREIRVENPVAGDAAAEAAGERLFVQFNCAGCHGTRGGGGIGPPLADGSWIYGGESGQIYLSISQGRPNGMPAFGRLLPDVVVWQLVSFVSSLPERAGTAGTGSASGGGDAEALSRQTDTAR
jgi:cytochrome c oxidase cbb3-type subunit 3